MLKSMGGLYSSVCGIAAFGIVLFSTPAMSAEKKSKVLLEEVIVTAQRREQNAQDVATSMSVFSQQQIADANISSTTDLASITPSMSVNTMFGPDNAAFNIRGFSKELRTTATVGVYFAEVVAPRGQILQTSGDGAGPGTLFDLQNIQVLKGPQGTLFGRNTTGGSVLLMPQRPTDLYEGYVELSAGNYNMYGGQFVVNTPITDNIRMRFGIDKKNRDGYLKNLSGIGGSDFGDANHFAARLSLVVDITDTLESYTVLNYSESDSKGYTSKLFACNANPAEAPFSIFRPQACERQLQRQEAAGDGFYDVISTVEDPGTEIEDYRIINHFTWMATDNITIKNIVSYSHLESFNNQDLFGTQFTEVQSSIIDLGVPIGLIDSRREFLHGYSIVHPDFPVTSQESITVELQAIGLSLDQKLQWQTGLYYEKSSPDGPSGNITASSLNCELKSLATGDPSQFNCFDLAAGLIGTVLVQAFETEYTNKAVYAQATYDILENLSVTVGARYTMDKTEGAANKEKYGFTANLLTRSENFSQIAIQESNAPTGVFELQYRPVDGVMTYAKYVRGYRQGGINLATDPGVDVYGEETVDNYEIGAKTEFYWPVPTRFNISVYDNDLRDMQLQSGFVSQTSGSTTAIFNAGRASIRGVEFDGYMQLFERLSTSFSYSYIDSELVEQNLESNQQRVSSAAGPVGGLTFTPIAVQGDTLPYTPDHSYTISLDYLMIKSEGWGDVDVGATYASTGKQRATASSFSPFSELDKFSVLNLNLNWTNVFATPLSLSLFATNITDEEYVTFVAGTYNALGIDSRSAGQPKMYGMRLKYNFGESAN
ncbi:TonB-dependent receptor [Zhongshania aquimaris]|uniref:TonB-dependent receptor n=1 Tax=Zhongshania aquimaris TaxID=2857107 RepID=A0ABS6VYK4_9GAMM|nr:TonB-dependent receptor [Zhongshania aquimaris]MBW2942716.1 TonB-dependent receptor [Zhongshania aquimaris]